MKKCYVCNIFKDFAEFSKNKRMNDGFNRKCKSCVREYRIKTKEKISEYGKRKYYENIEYNRLKNKNYRINNKEKMKCLKKNYRLNNQEKLKEYAIKYRPRLKELSAIRRRDPQKRLRGNMSSLITVSLRYGKEGKSWNQFLDYTLSDLVSHLESKFTKGMTWENYGKNGWHVDHIVPRSYFDHSSVGSEEFKQCWALSNLQPLWATTKIAMSYGESSDYIGNLDKGKSLL
jgi:hypothetical protein